jgi:hypothetical protein
MKHATGVGGQADDVACVGRDFGLDKNNMKHVWIVPNNVPKIMPWAASAGALRTGARA